MLRLWEETMLAYDALQPSGYSHFVYGETTGWLQVADCLENWRAQGLQYRQYGKLPEVFAQRD